MKQIISSMSIRKKLFAMILVILTINFLLLVLLGSTLFQSFYEGNKIRELRSTTSDITKIYSQNTTQSWESFYSEIDSVERRNNEVVIYKLAEEAPDSLEILYHSRMRNSFEAVRIEPLDKKTDSNDSVESDKDEENLRIALRLSPPALVPLYSRDMITQMTALEIGDLSVNTDHFGRGSRISIVSRLDEEVFLVMDTPREYITETADLAVKYSAFVSIAVLFVGAVIIYWLSGRFTKPIREIDAVAQQIATLDFSASCKVKGGDELGALASSINHMSDELQKSISVLQDDLAHQQETDRMRRQFVSDVSHDFKTPLTLMISYAEAIRSGKEPDKTGEFCDIITDEGNRLSRMVGRLLELSRLESGTVTLEAAPFSLNQLLDDTLRSMQLAVEGKRLSVTRHYSDEIIVNADYNKLCQVAYNLLDNAVKYTPEGGSVELVTRQLEGDLCEVNVINSGSHIDEAELDSIFASFYRADRSRERAQQSYGLGLAIVKTIVELHGQHCTACNTDDGVCFSFALPTLLLEDDEE